MAVHYCHDNFGVIVRAEDGEGLWSGVLFACEGEEHQARISHVGNELFEKHALAETVYDPGTEWHTYRVEVDENEIHLLIDGESIAKVSHDGSLSSGRVGLWSNAARIKIRDFRVIALEPGPEGATS